MAIKRVFYKKRSDEVNLYRTYSDLNMKIIQNETGNKYNDAVDVEDSVYTYSETNEPIESINDKEISDTEALDIIVGRDTNNG